MICIWHKNQLAFFQVFMWVCIHKLCEKEGKEKNPCIKHTIPYGMTQSATVYEYFPPKLTGGWEVATSTLLIHMKNEENEEKREYVWQIKYMAVYALNL